jgi:hypothetical protein
MTSERDSKGNRNGIVQLSIDGVNHGPPQDNYSAEVDYQVVDLGRGPSPKPARKLFNSWSQDRIQTAKAISFFDYVDLVR